MSIAFIFPGQGSQSIGMGHALHAAFDSARDVFLEVDDALDQPLSGIMFNGPDDDLRLTANTQPALMACSIAVMRVLQHDFDVPVTTAAYVAGHSLGEYSALCAAGSIELAKTAKLLKLRGEAMQQAVGVGQGAMAALLGASLVDAEMACQAGTEHGVCEIANDNATGQIVISGETAAVEAAAAAAREMGVKKAVVLPVSAPFHCSLMQPAADAMRNALADVDLKTPSVPLVSNVTARPVTDFDQIRSDLVAQVTGRVRWRESVEWMANHDIDGLAELGTGKVLTVMTRRIVKGLTATALTDPESIEAFAKQIKG